MSLLKKILRPILTLIYDIFDFVFNNINSTKAIKLTKTLNYLRVCLDKDIENFKEFIV